MLDNLLAGGCRDVLSSGLGGDVVCALTRDLAITVGDPASWLDGHNDGDVTSVLDGVDASGLERRSHQWVA